MNITVVLKYQCQVSVSVIFCKSVYCRLTKQLSVHAIKQCGTVRYKLGGDCLSGNLVSGHRLDGRDLVDLAVKNLLLPPDNSVHGIGCDVVACPLDSEGLPGDLRKQRQRSKGRRTEIGIGTSIPRSKAAVRQSPSQASAQ